ncbi:MAG TPA: ABC transporter permease [Spirochaetia bacterium]|nr:ABC transporter permease [Spirochaetia bacterium]
MPVLWRIAFRNIWEHKAKSFIIGTLVVLGVVVIVLGNAMIDSSKEGIRKTFIESFTGDVMIHGPSESAVSVFGVESMDGEMEIPTIPDYEKVLAEVKADPAVEKATSMALAYGSLALDADEVPQDEDDEAQRGPQAGFALVNGVDPATYFDMFPSILLDEGRYLKPGDKGIMVNREQLEALGKRYGKTLKVGDKILVNGFGTAGFKIREVEVVGLYKRKSEGTEGAPTVYVDVDTARVLGGLTLGADEAASLAPEQTALLSSDDLDSLFGEDLVEEAAPVKKVDLSNTAGILGDTAKREALNQADTGAWHFILVRLKNSAAAPAFMAGITGRLKAADIDARATNWQGAAGSFGKFADIIRVVFVIAILIIAVVAVIIMMNTLVVSVIERTGEIGTMRALGAQRGYVRKMFLAETLALTLFFGLVGSALALGLVAVLNAIGIEAGSDLVRLLFGGKVLHLVPRVGSFVSTILMVFAVGYLAHIYPVSVALKIEPVRAMQND